MSFTESLARDFTTSSYPGRKNVTVVTQSKERGLGPNRSGSSVGRGDAMTRTFPFSFNSKMHFSIPTPSKPLYFKAFESVVKKKRRHKKHVRCMMYIQMHRTFRRINLIFNIEWCLHLDRKCETRFTSEIVFYGPARTSRDFVFHHSFVLGSKRELLRTYRIVRSILQVIFYVRLTCCSMIFYFFFGSICD